MKNLVASILRRSPLCIAPLLLFCLLALLAGCGSSDSASTDYAATIAEAKTAAREAMTESSASALTLALVDGERVIWTESLGHADKEAQKAITPESMFGIGSVSKMFATIAVMKLVERGRVSLDAPLVTYLPRFSMISPEYRNITVRMLLNHAAGFPGGDMRNATTETPFTGFAAQVMDSMKFQRLKHAPGYLNVYSNDGFTMVENLVKAVTGTGYPEFVRQEILVPLGMNHSRYADIVLPDGAYAKPHNGNEPQPYSSLNVYATGGLYSTAADIGKLMMMLLNGGTYGAVRILLPSSIAAMDKDQTAGSFNPAPFAGDRFGLGWDTVTEAGLSAVGIKAWQKGGAIDGAYGTMYRAIMIVAPDTGLGVVVMMASNRISGDTVVKVGERILLRALVDRGILKQVPAPLPQNRLPVVAPTAAEKIAFSGFYAASGTLYRLGFAADDSLTVERYKGNVWTPEYRQFKKRSDGWYAADGDSIKALRLLTGSGRSYMDVRKPSGAGHYAATELLAQRLDARTAFSPVWQARFAAGWLPVNLDFLAGYLQDLDSDIRPALTAVDGLTGYLLADTKAVGVQVLCDMSPPSDNRLDGMFLQIPQFQGRDLADAAVERRDNAEWLRVGSALYRRQSEVPLVAAGTTAVTIGSEGFAEWRKLPVTGIIAIANAASWRLYNSDFGQTASGKGSGSAVLPGSGEAAYLMLFGAPGTAVHLTLSP